jgi:hypothetical protein
MERKNKIRGFLLPHWYAFAGAITKPLHFYYSRIVAKTNANVIPEIENTKRFRGVLIIKNETQETKKLLRR